MHRFGKVPRPLFDLQMSSKIQGLNVNWTIIYDFVYVLHRNIGHSIYRFRYISSNKSLRFKLDLSDLENDILSDSTPFIF